MAKVKSFTLTQPSSARHEVQAKWKFASVSKTDHFTVDFEYTVGKGWVGGNTQDYTPEQTGINKNNKWSTVAWSAPDSALQARARVKPVSKIKDEKKKTTYFSGAWSGYKTVDFRDDPLPAPSLSVNFDNTKNVATVTATCNDSDARYYEMWASNGSKVVEDKLYFSETGSYTRTYSLSAGQTWSFRTRCKSSGMKATSGWSAYSYATAKPGVPSLKGKGSAVGEDGVKFSWNAVTGADSYTVEYVADSASYFNTNRSAVQSVSDIKGTTFQQMGLELGHTYYMRVQAVNATGSSNFSAATSAKLALVPDAPTTYDTDPSYMQSSSVRLRWTHNCEDNADQTAAQVQMKLKTSSTWTTTNVNNSNPYLVKSLSGYADGSVVQWRVRTKGQRSEWSPYSVIRQFSVYSSPRVTCTLSQPSGTVDLSNPLTTLPLTIGMNASGGGNSVAGYHVTVTVTDGVTYNHFDGTTVSIAAGSVVYEKDYTTTSNNYSVNLGIEANMPDTASLAVVAEVVMTSGLRAESPERQFEVDFDSLVPYPDCSVAFDDDALAATVSCSCYALDEDEMQTDDLEEGVVLSVYRINADNSLTLIDENLPNNGEVEVIDPHATFGTCSYRVVATDVETGMTSYEDCWEDAPHRTCVVQWDESWEEYQEYAEDDGGDMFEYTGMRIDGLYNLNLDESSNIQAEDAEYIGRKHPVSYYGTQLGHTASYRVDFMKEDTDTLTKARRLMSYAGDAYVREPSGLGFWARISSPRISRAYDSQAVAFTFDAIHVDHAEQAVIIPDEEEEEEEEGE